MKKHLAALAATAAVVGGTIVITPAAQAADTPGCVSQKEFRQVKKRMTITKVHSIFDTKGKRDSITRGYGQKIEMRSYNACTRYGFVSIMFTNNKLDIKSAVF